jgi:hypothetical protein
MNRLLTVRRYVRPISCPQILFVAGCLVASLPVAGCASAPPAPSGFLHDYSHLQKVEEGRMRYISPKLKEYSRYMVDPVEFRTQKTELKPEQRAEVARYLRESFEKVLKKGGYQIAAQPDVGVARVRMAITEINKTKWYLNIHPATKVTGGGMGGAGMEGEVIDSVSGEQLGAVIQAKHASQFRLNAFSTISDVKNVIDQWAEAAGQTLDELHGKKKS